MSVEDTRTTLTLLVLLRKLDVVNYSVVNVKALSPVHVDWILIGEINSIGDTVYIDFDTKEDYDREIGKIVRFTKSI
jgi:hypothetical protein